MTARFLPITDEPRLTQFFISEYSQFKSPVHQLYRKIERVLAAEPINQRKLHALMTAEEKCFGRQYIGDYPHQSGGFPESLKDRIKELPWENDSIKRAYALAFTPEIETSVKFILELIDCNFKKFSLSKDTDEYLNMFNKGCQLHKYLGHSIWKSIGLIATVFTKIEEVIEPHLEPNSIETEIFERVRQAIQPVIGNAANRYQEPETLLVVRTSEEELLSSSGSQSRYTDPEFIRIAKLQEIEELASSKSWECLPTEDPDTRLSCSHETISDPTQFEQEPFQNLIETIVESLSSQEESGLFKFSIASLSTAWKENVLKSKIEEFLRGRSVGFGRQTDYDAFLVSKLVIQMTQFLTDYQACVGTHKRFFSFFHGNSNKTLSAMVQILQSRTPIQLFRNEHDPHLFAEDLDNYVSKIFDTPLPISEPSLLLSFRSLGSTLIDYFANSVYDPVLSPLFVLLQEVAENKEKTVKLLVIYLCNGYHDYIKEVEDKR